jgi:thioredoxin-related protein
VLGVPADNGILIALGDIMIRSSLIILLLAIPVFIQAQNTDAHKNTSAFHAYDPARDAAKDIQDAVALAGSTHRRVLMEIGGNWCIWCRYFEEFYAAHPDLRELRDKNYVLVRVNFSEENKNQPVISKYGEVPGYPHIFVLDSNGKLLYSKHTSELEQGRGYSEVAMKKFLEEWAPKQ